MLPARHPLIAGSLKNGSMEKNPLMRAPITMGFVGVPFKLIHEKLLLPAPTIAAPTGTRNLGKYR